MLLARLHLTLTMFFHLRSKLIKIQRETSIKLKTFFYCQLLYKMYNFNRSPALKVSRINLNKVNPMTEPKPVMITRSNTFIQYEKKNFQNFIKNQYRINVNELVNSELYSRGSLLTGRTYNSLRNNYSPQQMRAFLLIADSKKYQDGSYLKYDVTIPRRKNRGIDYSIDVEEMYNIIEDDIIENY